MQASDRGITLDDAEINEQLTTIWQGVTMDRLADFSINDITRHAQSSQRSIQHAWTRFEFLFLAGY